MADDVPLTDLEVVRRWSLAVRAATAPRDELVAALESDLAWLTGDPPRRASTRSMTGAARATAAVDPADDEQAGSPAPRRRRTGRRAPGPDAGGGTSMVRSPAGRPRATSARSAPGPAEA